MASGLMGSLQCLGGWGGQRALGVAHLWTPGDSREKCLSVLPYDRKVMVKALETRNLVLPWYYGSPKMFTELN